MNTEILRKIFFVVSLVAFIIFLFLIYLDMGKSCPYIWDSSMTICAYIGLFLILSVPIFIFSIIFLFFRRNEKVFVFWKKFTVLFLIIFLPVYLITPNEITDFVPVYKETVALGMATIYTFISVVISAFLLKK